ncbi:MAG: hypothetical protein UU47_C0008G0009 [candidate division TM6 bacterium GW2011_GWE2_41_16]|nr:MAG: hypothetical protein UU47_C0008G0009 [candidate division TM6 bacterium GW2011_GWE2_41_16]
MFFGGEVFMKKNLLSWFLLILSALMYGCAFIFSSLWWLTLIFLIPLLYLVIHRLGDSCEVLSYSEALVWSSVSMLLHLSGIGYSVMKSGPSAFCFQCMRLIPLVPIFCYVVFLSSTWLWLSARLIQIRVVCELGPVRIIIFIEALALYFYAMVHWLMCVFGRCEGYTLIDPMLPLARKPFFLYPMIVLDHFISLSLLVGFAALCAVTLYFFRHAQYKKMLFVVCGSVGIVCLWMSLAFWMGQKIQAYDPSNVKKVVNRIVHCVGFFPVSKNTITDACEAMRDHFTKALAAHPTADIILTHETVCRMDLLEYKQSCARAFAAQALGRPAHVLIGAFRWNGDMFHNTVYWFYDGVLKNFYDKRHAMAVEERLPWFLQNAFFKQVFFGKLEQITPSKETRKVFKLSDDIVCVPYICSEFFFNKKPDEPQDIKARRYTILAMCNDMWARAEFLKDLMALHARFKAIYWQRPVVYCAFCRGLFITPAGEEYVLAQYMFPDGPGYRTE